MKKLLLILSILFSFNAYSQGYIGVEGGFNIINRQPTISVKALLHRIELNVISQPFSFSDTKVSRFTCVGGGYLLPKMFVAGGGVGTMQEIPEIITPYGERGWNGTLTGCLYFRKYFNLKKSIDITTSLTAVYKVGIILGIGFSVGYLKEEYQYLK